VNHTKGSTLIVFSDLDGTLLNHETYDYAAAEPALNVLRQNCIPLVLASSKTAAEMAPLRAQLGFAHCPAIVENGAGLLSADTDNPLQDTGEYNAIRVALDMVPATLRKFYRGFGDMDANEVSAVTGLPVNAAALAAMRAFSEPGVWTGNAADQSAFEQELAAHNIHARHGGRFLTLSFGRTKAGLMRDLAVRLAEPSKPFIVALGDAPNDKEMVLAADRAFIIRNHAARPISFCAGQSTDHVTWIDQEAPLGWNTAVLSVVSHQTH